jgi:HSP20 family protein
MKIKNFIPQRFFDDDDPKEHKGYISPFYKVQKEMDDLFSTFYNKDFFTDFKENFLPKFDIMETDSQYLVKVEMPGIEEKDINISLNNRVLKIAGKKEHKKESKDMKYHRVEGNYGSFERSLELPDNIDEDNINAKFKNGILEICINKKEKDSSITKNITINKE